MTVADEAQPQRSAPSMMPPFLVLADFLEAAVAERLLEHAAQRAAAFAPTIVGFGAGARVDAGVRVSIGLDDLGDFAPLLRRRLRRMAGELTAALRVPPFPLARIELELVAHGDGAFYRRHIDTQVGADRATVRVVSGVYYAHRRPKRFSGGALRLYAIGDETRFVDLEPDHNTFVVFPSWAPHEVLPVSCPSGAFMDSRFAVNCWLRKSRAGGADPPPG